ESLTLAIMEPNLLAYYSFDDGFTRDKTSNNNNGTISPNSTLSGGFESDAFTTMIQGKDRLLFDKDNDGIIAIYNTYTGPADTAGTFLGTLDLVPSYAKLVNSGAGTVFMVSEKIRNAVTGKLEDNPTWITPVAKSNLLIRDLDLNGDGRVSIDDTRFRGVMESAVANYITFAYGGYGVFSDLYALYDASGDGILSVMDDEAAFWSKSNLYDVSWGDAQYIWQSENVLSRADVDTLLQYVSAHGRVTDMSPSDLEEYDINGDKAVDASDLTRLDEIVATYFDYGTDAKRSGITYDALGQITGYTDTSVSDTNAITTETIMSEMKYDKYGRMLTYTDNSHEFLDGITDITRTTNRLSGSVSFNDLGQIITYTDYSIGTNMPNSERTTAFSNITYNKDGQMEGYDDVVRENKTGGEFSGFVLESETDRRGIVYNAKGQVSDYTDYTYSTNMPNLITVNTMSGILYDHNGMVLSSTSKTNEASTLGWAGGSNDYEVTTAAEDLNMEKWYLSADFKASSAFTITATVAGNDGEDYTIHLVSGSGPTVYNPATKAITYYLGSNAADGEWHNVNIMESDPSDSGLRWLLKTYAMDDDGNAIVFAHLKGIKIKGAAVTVRNLSLAENEGLANKEVISLATSDWIAPAGAASLMGSNDLTLSETITAVKTDIRYDPLSGNTLGFAEESASSANPDLKTIK
ncbi:MAG: hypothetical protein KKE81_02040, partial [Candidatus Omnitrophica bacterium]|nr:hypothetical protein [Candidatus Omnitrophota bacterium]